MVLLIDEPLIDKSIEIVITVEARRNWRAFFICGKWVYPFCLYIF